MTLTAETRLGILAQSLGHWCENQTYRSSKWIYGWNRTDFPDRYRFTVTVGGVPATDFEVTEAQLEETPVFDLWSAWAEKLEPHTLPERNDEL